jgi:hypothetical protein
LLPRASDRSFVSTWQSIWILADRVTSGPLSTSQSRIQVWTFVSDRSSPIITRETKEQRTKELCTTSCDMLEHVVPSTNFLCSFSRASHLGAWRLDSVRPLPACGFRKNCTAGGEYQAISLIDSPHRPRAGLSSGRKSRHGCTYSPRGQQKQPCS